MSALPSIGGAAAAAALLAVSGCSSASAADPPSTPPSPTVRVGLLEWQIVTAGAALTGGLDTLTVTNTGTTAHNLHVTGPGTHAHTRLLPPGGTQTLTLLTRAGSALILTCDVPGHDAAGMHATLQVERRVGAP